jgi:hypothetical protein
MSYASGSVVSVTGCYDANPSQPCGVWTVDAFLSSQFYSTCATNITNTAVGLPVYTFTTLSQQKLYGYTYLDHDGESAMALIGTVHCARNTGVLYEGTFVDIDEPFSPTFTRAEWRPRYENPLPYDLSIVNVSPPPPAPNPPPLPPPTPPPWPPPSPPPYSTLRGK